MSLPNKIQKNALNQKSNEELSVVYKAPSIFQKLKNKEVQIAVVGLGYVGLPLALELGREFKVLGFDLNPEKVTLLQEGLDPNEEVNHLDLKNENLKFSSNINSLSQAQFYVVAVPTPVGKDNEPDLKPLVAASKSIAKVLKKGDYVVYESTVFPGCTEHVCVPILEQFSGLKLNADFKVGYSPERINPGDQTRSLTQIVKVVSGSDEVAKKNIAQVYGAIIEAGIHEAETIQVAEASKVIENIQRDVNIALMNELATIFKALHINTQDVLKASGTKWNFLPFHPGLVGGHCIGVDPYYLIHKALEHQVEPRLIQGARQVNNDMVPFVQSEIEKLLTRTGKNKKELQVLFCGLTFKENVKDLRNSKNVELFQALQQKGYQIVAYDPKVTAPEMKKNLGINTRNALRGKYDAIIMGAPHKNFKSKAFRNHIDLITLENAIVFDVSGKLKAELGTQNYYTL